MPDDAAQQGQQGTQQQGAPGGDAGGQQQQQQAPARPDWLPEKFWQADKGAPNVEGLAKSYGELERGRGKVKDTVRAEVMTEFFGQRPEKPEAYALTAPEGAEGVVILDKAPGEDFQPQPGTTYFQLREDSKALPLLRQIAYDHGVPAGKVQELMAEVAREMGQRIPTDADQQQSRGEFFRSIGGEHGERRVQHTWGNLKSLLGEDALSLDAVVGDPKAFLALEKLVARAGGSRFAPPAAGGNTGPITEAELRSMQNDPKYLAGDPVTVAKVTDGYRALYG